MENVVSSSATQNRRNLKPLTGYRIESIDILRGLIMIIMALDHVRDYFHSGAFTGDPLDLNTTTPILYFTRWITHLCAPLFVFLSGTSASLVGERKGKKYLSRFLLTRGIWLIILELTVVSFAWFFNPKFTTQLLGVIWAIGWSMIFLAGLIHLPRWAIAAIGLVMVFGHNLLDGIQVTSSKEAAFGWALLHQFNFFQFDAFTILVGYPVIPWIGVMALGYCLGSLYTKEVNADKRKQWLLWLGVGSLLLFTIIRYTNSYGNPFPWEQQSSGLYTFLSFINVHKYPPSLLYLLVTIGPGLIFLAYTENWRDSISRRITIIGRVPMFYYLVHLYLIHTAALVAAVATGRNWTDMVNFSTWVTIEPKLQGYGFSLGFTYAVWAALLVILYFMCKWYDRYKMMNKDKWWLSYL